MGSRWNVVVYTKVIHRYDTLEYNVIILIMSVLIRRRVNSISKLSSRYTRSTGKYSFGDIYDDNPPTFDESSPERTLTYRTA